MNESQIRMQLLAGVLSRLIEIGLPQNVRYLLVLQEDGGGWASHGDSVGWLAMAADWAGRSERRGVN